MDIVPLSDECLKTLHRNVQKSKERYQPWKMRAPKHARLKNEELGGRDVDGIYVRM